MSKHNGKFYDLTLACLCGMATEDQRRLLGRILEEEPALRKEYLGYISLFTLLCRRRGATVFTDEMDGSILDQQVWKALAEEELRAETIVPEKPKKCLAPKPLRKLDLQRPPRKVSKFKLVTAIVSAAALIFLLVYVQLNPVQTPRVVARLTDCAGAEWADSTEILQKGDRLYTGPIELVKGLAEVTFDSGAEVLIQAPAEIALEGSNHMYLQQGKLTANILKGGAGFTVSTPTARVVDHGTVFGVKVDETGGTRAHVFKGAVDLYAGGKHNGQGAILKLFKGEAGGADDRGYLRTIDIDKSDFAGHIPSLYELAVRSCDPWGYLQFEPHEDRGITSIFTTNGGAVEYSDSVRFTETDAMLGSDRSSRALILDGRQSYMTIRRESIPHEQDPVAYTHMFWVKPDSSDEQLILAGFMPNSVHFRCLGISAEGHFEHYFFDSLNKTKTHSLISEEEVTAGRWYHIAIVATTDKTMRKYLYVNGQATTGFQQGGYMRSAYAPALCFGYKPKKFREQGGLTLPLFSGSVDEIAIFDRNLSAEEIRRIYQAALRGNY